MNCLRCNRALRWFEESAQDKPGTVRLAGRGCCEPCRRASILDGTWSSYVTIPRPVKPSAALGCCPQCKRPTRPSGASLEQFPGTVRAKAVGLCGACYNTRYHNGPVQRLTGDAGIQDTRDGLERYLASRRSKRLELGTR